MQEGQEKGKVSAMMEKRFLYIGCFPNPREFQEKISGLPGSRLERVIEHPHVTFRFAPKDADTSLFGQIISLRITGYGNNGKNEGVSVTLRAEDPALQEMIDAITVPHITLSVSKDGVPYETRNLSFQNIPPMELRGLFGGMTEHGRVITK